MFENYYFRNNFISSVINQEIVDSFILRQIGKSDKNLNYLCRLKNDEFMNVEIKIENFRDSKKKTALYYTTRLLNSGFCGDINERKIPVTHRIMIFPDNFPELNDKKLHHKFFIKNYDKNPKSNIQIHIIELEKARMHTSNLIYERNERKLKNCCLDLLNYMEKTFA